MLTPAKPKLPREQMIQRLVKFSVTDAGLKPDASHDMCV